MSLNHFRKGVRIEINRNFGYQQGHGITPARECVLKFVRSMKQRMYANHSRKGVRIEMTGFLRRESNPNHSRKGVCIEIYLFLQKYFFFANIS